MPRAFYLVRNLFPLLVLIALSAPFASASGPYVIGSGNTVTADPNVLRPSTTPCVVTLFSNYEFDNNFNLNPFSYTPPADCPGPWAKVVLEVNIDVTAGNQFDRTANIWLGGTNIFFGTTAEPSSTLSPSWHVESDLTDYSPLFSIAQSGSVYLGNTVNSIDTSIQSATAILEFYPLAPGQAAPATANVVLPLSAGPNGGTATLNTGSDTLSTTVTLPTNIESAYLDIYSQGQIGDEFWYFCVPNDVAAELESCGNTAFRETEITIDNQPAGVAPVFPWIFTGGIDPFLWFPIPGVQTLNFTPYRVNLTPFAGLLSDGQPHTISLSVYNANGYFSATAALLLYLDSGSTQTTGAITKNTLTAPSPVVTENLKVQPAYVTGTVDVGSNRSFAITGYVNTSKGKVTTTVAQSVGFWSHQYFYVTPSGSEDVQDAWQDTTVGSYTMVSRAGVPSVVYYQNYNFPLTVDYALIQQPNGNYNQTTKADQTYELATITTESGRIKYNSALVNTGQHRDTLEINSSFTAILGNSGQSASQQYDYFDSTGARYFCDISAIANVLTAFSPGCAQ
jgi:peptide N-acetyl-beta-D-glucosaminyl asparaginase amidase A